MNEENKKLVEGITKHFDEKTEEIKGHFDVVAEEMKSDFKVFGEQLSDVKTKVDSLGTKVDLLVEDRDYVKSEIVEIKDRFKETNETLEKKAEKSAVDKHEVRILNLEKATIAKA